MKKSFIINIQRTLIKFHNHFGQLFKTEGKRTKKYNKVQLRFKQRKIFNFLKLPIFNLMSEGCGYGFPPLWDNNIFCGFKSRCKIPLAYSAFMAPAKTIFTQQFDPEKFTLFNKIWLRTQLN